MSYGVEILFLKEGLQFIPGRLFCCGFPPRVVIPENKIFAEVAPVFFENALRLGFPTLVINPRIVKPAVQAAPQIVVAEGTDILPPDYLWYGNLFSAAMANLHGTPV